MNSSSLTMKKRNFSLDLLKIAAMIMVVLLHATSHGIKGATVQPLSPVSFIINLVNSFSLVAVNCFILISGYFLSSKFVAPGKIIPLWIQVWTYSVGIYLILCCLPVSGIKFNPKELIRCALPLMTQQYWFFTFYVLLYWLAPVTNKLIASLSKEEYQRVLFLVFLLFSLIPSINIWTDSFQVNNGYGLIWFLVLYLIAGYIRRWPPVKSTYWLIGYLSICLFLSVFRFISPRISGGLNIISVLINNQTSYNSPVVLAASLCLFLYAVATPIHNSSHSGRWIAFVSALTFGVYLLHDHGFMRPVLWNQIVKLQDYIIYPGKFLLHLLSAVISIFVFSVIIEWIRQKICSIPTFIRSIIQHK